MPTLSERDEMPAASVDQARAARRLEALGWSRGAIGRCLDVTRSWLSAVLGPPPEVPLLPRRRQDAKKKGHKTPEELSRLGIVPPYVCSGCGNRIIFRRCLICRLRKRGQRVTTEGLSHGPGRLRLRLKLRGADLRRYEQVRRRARPAPAQDPRPDEGLLRRLRLALVLFLCPYPRDVWAALERRGK